MRTAELSLELKDAYETASKREQVLAIHLFGIRRSKELRSHSLKDVAIGAGIAPSYATELRKAVNIGDHVTLNR